MGAISGLLGIKEPERRKQPEPVKTDIDPNRSNALASQRRLAAAASRTGRSSLRTDLNIPGGPPRTGLVL